MIPVALAGSDSNPRACHRTLLLASLRVQRLLRAPPAAGPIVLAGRHRRPGHHEGTPAVRDPGVADRRRSRRVGRPFPPSYRWCCRAGSSTGPLGAVLAPAHRCAPDPVPPPFRHSRPARTGISQMPVRVGTVPAIATALAGAHLPIASGRIVRHPRAGQRQAHGAPGAGNADDVHAGPGLAPQSRRAFTRRMRSADGPPRGRGSGPRSAP